MVLEGVYLDDDDNFSTWYYLVSGLLSIILPVVDHSLCCIGWFIWQNSQFPTFCLIFCAILGHNTIAWALAWHLFSPTCPSLIPFNTLDLTYSVVRGNNSIFHTTSSKLRPLILDPIFTSQWMLSTKSGTIRILELLHLGQFTSHHCWINIKTS